MPLISIMLDHKGLAKFLKADTEVVFGELEALTTFFRELVFTPRMHICVGRCKSSSTSSRDP